ncbi:MAG: major capsid protein [Muribaculaceae bacterium]|nr:major capsid protein [Muribaculaceae bacterium]
MEQSLYFEIVRRYFPQLVLSIVERLNEKRTNQLPYFYKEFLTPTFTADCRWASILADYNRVAADVVALDSELPLKSRDTIEKVSGDIPKLGMKLYLTEKDMKTIDAMIAQNLPINQIVNRIFDDLPRCLEGVWERIEDIFLSELSTGVGLSKRNNGTGVRVDVGYLTANKFGTSSSWDTAATCTPVDDIQKIFDKALDDQNTIITVFADDVALNRLYKSQQVREQYAFNQGFVGNKIPILDFDKINNVFFTKWGVNVRRVARKVKTEINGTKQSTSPYQAGTLVFVCDTNLGNLVWTNVAESTRPVRNVEYQTADNFILLSKYSTNDPLREFTSSQAMVVPVINNVDRIYTLDSSTVQG